VKRLFLLRHAKSSWANTGQPDRDRPLNARGRTAAPLIGSYLRAHDYRPDLVLCSPAVRARQTLELVLTEAGWMPQVAYDPDLYPGDPDRVFGRIRDVEESIESLLAVGHNPGWQELALALSGSGGPADLRRLREKFPTAGLAILSFPDRTWKTVARGRGALTAFVTPKDLAQS
jgi:phosphohistidine phosphatase